MKALLISLFLTLLPCFTVFAQTQDISQQFHPTRTFGIQGGANYSWMGEAKADAGFHGGLFIEMHTAKRFGFTIKGLYSRQNFIQGDEGKTVNYLVLPFLLNYHATKVLKFQGGGYLGHLLKSDIIELPTSDLGFALGLKLDLGHVGIGSTYFIGMQDLNNSNSNVSQVNSNQLRNRNLQFWVNIGF